MPQDSLIPSDPRATGLTITFEEVPEDGGQTWIVTVRRHEWPTYMRTVARARMSGYMVDFVATLASEATSAFFFGDDRDLARSVASVLKQARKHARHHERVG